MHCGGCGSGRQPSNKSKVQFVPTFVCTQVLLLFAIRFAIGFDIGVWDAVMDPDGVMDYLPGVWDDVMDPDGVMDYLPGVWVNLGGFDCSICVFNNFLLRNSIILEFNKIKKKSKSKG